MAHGSNSWCPIDPVKYFLLFLAVAALAAASCQRIPPSVSIPGYGEKNAEHVADEAHAAPAKHGE